MKITTILPVNRGELSRCKDYVSVLIMQLESKPWNRNWTCCILKNVLSLIVCDDDFKDAKYLWRVFNV